MKNQSFRLAEETNSPLVILVSLLTVACIGVIDYETGVEISFTFFYLMPILFVLWRSAVVAAVMIAVLGAVVSGTVDMMAGHAYSQPWIPVWNAFMHLAFFLVVVYLGHHFRKELVREKNMIHTDPLTGVANMRYLRERADMEISRARRFGRPFSLAYIDVDDFKRVNDIKGHGKGDALLCHLAGEVHRQTRKYDLVARVGGDEFVVLLPETDGDQALKVAAKIRNVASNGHLRSEVAVTFSIGVVTYRVPPFSIDDAIKAADELMCLAKQNGKNEVKCRVIKA